MSTTKKDRERAWSLLDGIDKHFGAGSDVLRADHDRWVARIADALASERERAAVNAMIALGRTRKFAEKRVRELAGGAAAFTDADRVINCILRGDA